MLSSVNNSFTFQPNIKAKTKAPSFEGLSENVNLARKELHVFHDTFGHPSSDSFIKLRRFQHRNDSKYNEITKKLKIKANQHANKMMDSYYQEYIMNRFGLPTDGKSPDRDYFIEKLTKDVKDTNVANCDQISDLLCDQLNKKGAKAKIVNFSIINKDKKCTRKCGGHSFVVLDMDEKAKINDPSTWGKDAVIADAWANIAEPVSSGLKHLQEIFRFDSKTDNMEYGDLESILDLVKIFRRHP